MKSIQVGDAAPNFAAETHDGKQISLSDYRDKQVVVLYFYPKNDTSVCTAEACAFRDSYEDFSKLGAVVIGVSSDSLASHRAFAGRQKLPFLLISDASGDLRKSYGVPKTFGLIPGRVTYVIDQQGIVQHVFNSLFSARRHVTKALEIVGKLAQAGNDRK